MPRHDSAVAEAVAPVDHYLAKASVQRAPRDFTANATGSIFLFDVVLVLDLLLIRDESVVPRVLKIVMNVNVVGPPRVWVLFRHIVVLVDLLRLVRLIKFLDR
jgi:hypothetical protein